MIRKLLPAIMAKNILGVQPMTGTGAIFNIEPWSDWRRTISIWPRKSVTGKIIFGWINKRSTMIAKPVKRGKPWRVQHIRIREYMTNKELFKAKLEGAA